MVKDIFATTNPRLSLLRRTQGFIFAFLGFTAVKPFLHSGEPLHHGEETAIDHNLPLHLIFSITLLDFPSNPAKHKKMGN